MSIQTRGLTPTRAFDYLALAKLREHSALLARDPARKAFFQQAARYARKKAVAVEPLPAESAQSSE
ncbi:MAG: hypothetical protein AAF050_01940 [Cyanobacteria bacterium J06649_5]